MARAWTEYGRLLDQNLVDAELDRLESEQEDGGWRVDFASYCSRPSSDGARIR